MSQKVIRIGFSPCPNDTFIFDALVNKKIDTGNLVFDPVIEDVETLNNRALLGELPVTKVSYGVFPLLLDKYNLLNSGSALGRGVGPLLIAKEQAPIKAEDCIIAIPGEYTTAHFLFSLAYPTIQNKIFMRYDEIEGFVLAGNPMTQKLGVIIHENRFTYEQKGLKKIMDLGDYWEQQTSQPIPLGGIVVDRAMDPVTQKVINGLIRKSIEYAYSKYPKINGYIKSYAQEMSEDIMRKHIDLYVNKYSFELGEEGRGAVMALLKTFNKIHGVNTAYRDFFIE